MFGILDGIEKSVGNALDVGLGVLTLGECGRVDKQSLSKLISDGIEIAVLAEALDVAEDVLEKILEDD